MFSRNSPLDADCARWIQLTIAAALLIGLAAWWICLVRGTFENDQNNAFWTALVALAPTLAIAYAVTISDAVRTYQSLREGETRSKGHQLRVTMAFVGGATGAFFGFLLAVVAWVALQSILGESAPGSPHRQIALVVTAMAFAPVVPFLAHGWSPWKKGT